MGGDHRAPGLDTMERPKLTDELILCGDRKVGMRGTSQESPRQFCGRGRGRGFPSFHGTAVFPEPAVLPSRPCTRRRPLISLSLRLSS